MAKLHSRADPCRYLFPSNETSITILNMKTNRAERARAIDFIPYDSQTDPAATTSAALKSFTMHRTPKFVNTTTPAPKTHGQAKRYPDADLWAEAHDNELNHIDDQNIINWIPDSEVPKGTRLIPLTMTYRYKRDERGTIISRKARCSFRGDKMQANIHYDPDSTTTYTADKTTVRLLLAIAATFEMQLDHLDITAAYLHGKFAQTGTEKVYVKQFARFDGSMKHSATAGILNGNLYGGPTAGNTYLEAVFSLLRQRKFQQSDADPCSFFRREKKGATFVAVTIDDFIVAASKTSYLDTFHGELSAKYKVKRLGFPKQYLGWTTKRCPDRGIHVSQPAAIQALIGKTNMCHANGKHTPYVDGSNLHPPRKDETEAPVSAKKFQQILGELRYIADSTRPDIYYAANRLGSAAKNPTQRHWNGLNSLIRYLKATKNHGIYFPSRRETRTPITKLLQTFSDSDHAGDTSDRKSVTGVVHMYNCGPISWTSSKQTIHALSTCEAEYIAAATAAQQTLWVRRMLADMRMLPNAATPMYIDNMATIRIAKNTGPTKRRKYIDLRHHFLHAQVARRRLCPVYIPSKHMLADALTKPLKRQAFRYLLTKMNIRPS